MYHFNIIICYITLKQKNRLCFIEWYNFFTTYICFIPFLMSKRYFNVRYSFLVNLYKLFSDGNIWPKVTVFIKQV